MQSLHSVVCRQVDKGGVSLHDAESASCCLGKRQVKTKPAKRNKGGRSVMTSAGGLYGAGFWFKGNACARKIRNWQQEWIYSA